MISSTGVAVTTAAEVQDPGRFWELVRQQQERAVAVAFHIVGGDREAARDVAQEAFLKAYQELPRFRGEASLSTWFYRILVNQAKNHRRRQWVQRRWQALWNRSAVGDPPPISAGQGQGPLPPDHGADRSELRARVSAAMERLTLNQRTAFSLVHLEGMSVAETAEVMGVSPGTLKSHLHRALVKLRRELSDLREFE